MSIRTTRRSIALNAPSNNFNKKEHSQPSTFTSQRAKSLENGDGCSERLGATSSHRLAKTTPTPRGLADSGVKCQILKTPANVRKKRKRNVLSEYDSDPNRADQKELPHNMGQMSYGDGMPAKHQKKMRRDPLVKKPKFPTLSAKEEENELQSGRKLQKLNNEAIEAVMPASAIAKPEQKSAVADLAIRKPEKKIKLKTKQDTYGISEGVSPFPNYQRPTREECYKVAERLRKTHPNCHPRPKTIPEPSKIVAGCGEVPSILDAMIRTLLSAATNGRNSSNAYQGMIRRYGSRETGVGKGSVDYNAVRTAPQADLEKAIASGGLAKNKSKNIKAILDMVYEENQQRRKEILEMKDVNGVKAEPVGAVEETDEQKSAEITLAEENVLSLDHLYYLPTYAAISHFIKYPGIGVKTAACVALFCMQRDCFAVDTHVFRLCKWLGWVPDQSAPGYVKAKGEPRVDRDPTFSHLEVRIPDELKYELHQLFIQHGKKCGRCRGNTTVNHPDWAKGCPIEEFMTRKGPRKGGSLIEKGAKGMSKSAKKRNPTADEDDLDEDIDMSDLVEDDDEEVEEALTDLDDEEV